MSQKHFIFLVFIFGLVSCTQNPKGANAPSSKTDSLDFFFDKANNNTLPYSKRQFYTKKAIDIISKGKNDSLNRINYFKVANRYFNMDALDDYKKITLIIVENSKTANDSVSLAKAYGYLADYYAKKPVSESAYDYNFKAQKIYASLKDNTNVAKALLNKAILQHNESDFLGCERSVFSALKNLRNTENDLMIYQSYNLLGIIYGELAEYKLSKEYYNKALEICISPLIPKENQSKATTLNNIGILFSKLNNEKKAIHYYKLGLQEKNLLKDNPTVFAMLTDNLAYSNFSTKNLSNIPKLFYDALKIRDSLNMVPGIILSKIHLSEYYAYKKDSVIAKRFAIEANNLAVKSNEKRDMLATLKQLSNVEPRKALKYSIQYNKINDSLQLAERKVRNKFARIEYETDELAIEKEHLILQRTKIISVGLAAFLLIVILVIFGYYVLKNRELKLKQQQQTANEEIYKLMLDQQQKVEEGKQFEKKRISQELHDGIMGKLTSIRLNLFVLNKKTDTETINKCLGQINEIQNIEKEIRTIAYDLQKNVFSDTINFVVVVKNLFAAIENHSDINFELYADERIDWDIIGSNIKIQIYRILQEALQNIDKYANAPNVKISMNKTENTIVIEVSDDGSGFDKTKIKRGMGLKNMKERAAEINGKIKISSEPGAGTIITLKVPL